MNLEQKMVREFHDTFGIHTEDSPTEPSAQVIERRINLINEETNELFKALRDRDLVLIADGIADLFYVTYGAAIECGIDMESIFKEVHRSNMTKKGGHFNSYGKLVKPDTYEPPKILPIINFQKGF